MAKITLLLVWLWPIYDVIGKQHYTESATSLIAQGHAV